MAKKIGKQGRCLLDPLLTDENGAMMMPVL